MRHTEAESTIHALIDYIKNETGLNCFYGERDLSSNEYPIVSLIHDTQGETQYLSSQAQHYTIPLRVTVHTHKKMALSSYGYAEKLIGSLGEFEQEKGHQITEGLSGRYEEDDFQLYFRFSLLETARKGA